MHLLLLLLATCLMTTPVLSDVRVRGIPSGWALIRLRNQFSVLEKAVKSGNKVIFLKLKNVEFADDDQKVQEAMESLKGLKFRPTKAEYSSPDYKTIVGTYVIKQGTEVGPKTFDVEIIEDHMSPTGWKIQSMASDNQ